jgi:hypothetical protein
MMARCRLELAKKQRSDFEKTKLQICTNPAGYLIEKTCEEGEVAGKGGRQWWWFYKDRR